MSSPLLGASSLLVMGVFTAGCAAGPVGTEDLEDFEETQGEIRGGYEDDFDTAVVGIYDDTSGSICSGSLLAPNVVLTARHCVSETIKQVNGGVACGTTGFSGYYPASGFFVTTLAEMPFTTKGYHTVREVILPPAPDDSFCGNDVAILILSDLVDPSEAVPLVPRVDVPIFTGEEYYAVGYGAVNDAGSDAGIRRRRDNLFIDCVAEECPSWYVKPTEWIGDTGVCVGDSGGPSLDLANRVTGITSRGSVNCNNPIYGYVLAWGEWIKDTTVYAAGLGGYGAPPWATGFPTDPAFTAPVGGKCDAAEECPANACVDHYCTRPCNEIAACPGDYSCKGDPGFCKKKPKQKAEDEGRVVSCSVQPGDDPTKPIPWLVGAGALGALTLLRRRRASARLAGR